MEIWNYWLAALQDLLIFFSAHFDISFGAAIVVLTLVLRVALLPLSWFAAYTGCINQKRVQKLQPRLEAIRKRYQNDPQALSEKMFKLYKDYDVSLVPGRSLLGGLMQVPVFLAMFQLLQNINTASKFLWATSLSRPDVLFALLASVAAALMIAANPDLPEQARIMMIALPSIVTFIVALNFASGLAVYWLTSNLFTAAHTVAVHSFLNRQIRKGKVRI